MPTEKIHAKMLKLDYHEKLWKTVHVNNQQI